jgi:hypothetical protein
VEVTPTVGGRAAGGGVACVLGCIRK